MVKSKFLVLLLPFVLLTACKLTIIVPPGGAIATVSGNYSCGAGENCEINVTDLLFEETFIAQPAGGYQFSHWVTRSGFFCGGEAASCTLSTELFDGVPQLLAYLASDDAFYLEPRFSPITGTGDANIRGSISRGVLLLVDEYGYIHDVEIVFDRAPDTDSNNDTFYDSYSFNFSDLSSNKKFRLYLIKGGEILSVVGGSNSPSSNVFNLAGATAVDLGLVDNVTSLTGIVLTQFDMFSQVGVSLEPSDFKIPIRTEQPPVIGFNNAQLVSAGLGAFANGWLGGAVSYLDRAVLLTEPGASNDADTARFFLALAQLGTLGSELPTDDNPILDRVSDVLDLLEIPDGTIRGSARSIVGSPVTYDEARISAEQAQDFADKLAKYRIGRAAALLRKVSPAFNTTWIRTQSGEAIENDHADAAFFLAIMRLLQAKFDVADAYDTTTDLNDLTARQLDESPANDGTVEAVLNENPDFLALEETAALTSARTKLLDSIVILERAIGEMQAETDPQDNDLIRVTSLELNGDDFARTTNFLRNLKTSIINGETLIEPGGSGPDGIDPTEDLILNLEQFFSGGVDLRGAALLPVFTGNDLDDSQPCLPDPTFNGVVISPNLDESIYDDVACE